MSSPRSVVVVAVLATAAVMLLSSVSGDVCPSGSLVYPYWSVCTSPALYNGLEVYTLQSYGTEEGSLAPEWDETNSTYYVRLSEEGATYKLVPVDSEPLDIYVTQSQPLKIQNVDTGRSLAWREEGEGEYFLIESDDDSASLLITVNDSVSLPCPRIYTAQCHGYDIVLSDSTSVGLSPYTENSVTYFKQGTDLVSFLVRRSDSSVLATPA